jgi:transposase-like protein
VARPGSAAGPIFIRNLLIRVPKAAHGIVATYVRTIFAQPDTESVRAQHARTVEHLRGRFQRAADMLADAAEELLAFTAFPKEHWRQIWSNNPQERLNREIRRRTDVVGIFPNREAMIRLVGAVLCEIHDVLVARLSARMDTTGTSFSSRSRTAGAGIASRSVRASAGSPSRPKARC